VSLTRLENYCVVYLATLESRDVICANWRPAAQFRVRSCAIRLCPHRSFPSRLDKIMRLHAQTATIENGFVHLPRDAHWLADYLHELTVLPNGRYDDQVD
jgi:hypothetical protein